ncbi:MAG TPA: methyltransferase domain-containing protein [Acidobacteriota bacterium]|jgi:SAM-dependent methyltransferase
MVKTTPAIDDRGRYYRFEAEEGSFLSPGYSQLVLRDLYQTIEDRNVLTIYDIGSGRGYNIPALRQRFPASLLIALDLNWNALSAARNETSAAWPVQCDALTLPLEDSRADLAVCTEVLEHVADLDSAVREIARVVRPGGYAVISSPNYLNLMGLRKWIHDRRNGLEHWDPWGGHPGFERFMVPRLVRHAVEPHFRILRVRGAGFAMAWIPLGYRRIGRLNDRFPLARLGRWPLFRSIAVNRYLLLQKRP